MIESPRSRAGPARWLGSRSKSMLGKAQLAWLEETLARADEAPLVVLVSGVPWITNRKWEPPAGCRKYSGSASASPTTSTGSG